MKAVVNSLADSEPSDDSDSHALENTPAGASVAEKQLFHEESRWPPRRRADALLLLAVAFLKDSKVASTTNDRLFATHF